ncbi:saccharopine dehydrogenase [Agrobacterium pusense]|uniref:saccharopine dehydrogenase n=1 Tax=Agrobacterium pusense TaxID=648995 RepID=UPI00088BDA6D|nr:saccharopine dehydrogenase [Agrobacterium pusense]OOO22947.1 saccharopine dehydrogenase [Agrobacterium pusense]WKD48083.1 NAD(P)-dependent oxidoreductase [Agrobacterium pusense]SDF59613.1 hypothetical protein SAMN05421750_11740 [Agrobacterium pusense]
MSPRPILLVGGTGKVGRWTARLLREEHPQIRFLIGGRNLEKAEEFARELGSAEAVPIDLTASDLGLGDRQVGAVAVFFTEDRLATVRFAQSRSVPHISISRALFEIGPEIAYFTQRPSTSPVVLGTEWLVGATTMPILSFAKAFGKIERISIGALLDEEDATGPAGFADFDRQNAVMPSALIRRSGEFHWLTGDKVKTSFNAADGSQTEATAFSVNDVIGLAAALDVPDIEFKLAIGTTSSRRRGEAFSTEIIIEMEGQDHSGAPLFAHRAITHALGQMPLTGLGVALVLQRLLGLDGQAPTAPGLYLPYQLLEPDAYLARFKRVGGVILDLAKRDPGGRHDA